MTMSAAVARQQQSSGHGGNSNTGSRLGSNSPVERRVKEEHKTTKSPTQNKRELQAKVSPKTSHKHTSSLSSSTTLDPPQVAVDHPPDPVAAAPNASNSAAAKPLSHARPPVLPPPPGADLQERPGDDYFNFQKHRLDQEPNPFEQSFSQTGETQRTVLPPASAITSPAPLIGGQTFGFMSSLRSGPLSPAMLQGPISGSNPLSFDSHIRTGLTPNESGIRSGLTPGGSGSIFPVPSPNTSSFLGFGGATPNTMEFQKTAITAAALKAHQGQHPPPTLNPTSIPKSNFGPPPNEDADRSALDRPRQLSNPFDSDPAHHAANGLYMLAQAHQQGDQYQSSHPAAGAPAPVPPPLGNGHMDISPNPRKRSLVTNAASSRPIAGPSNMPNTMRATSEMSEDMPSDSDESGDEKRAMKYENSDTPKRSGSTRRKATDSKGSNSTKRAKGNTGKAMSAGGSGDDGASDEKNDKNDGSNGKKMTDEEKRRNFLERNRVAALKCRQRKKQWLQNLQQKVELFSQENESLTTQVSQLREEIVALKTLLLAHKDCPISRQNGPLGGLEAIQSTLAGHSVSVDYTGHPAAAQFGMGVLPPGVHGHPGPRRYS